jgi:hypothetical protein
MRRRVFVNLPGGIAVIPLNARAQERKRQVGIMMNIDNAESREGYAGFRQVL